MMTERPNIVFIIADDHAKNAVGCYGSRFGETTPNIDRIAREGARFANFFNTNALCSPSRACILTGAYGHVNGVIANTNSFDCTQDTFPQRLQAAGYQTAIYGKWHLGHGGTSDPVGFDDWSVLPHQGNYFDPQFLGPEGEERNTGYVTDIITDKGLKWLEERDKDRPFLLWMGHKAPHRSWEPDDKHKALYVDQDLPEPETLKDDYATRGAAAKAARMRLNPHLNERDLKGKEVPEGVDRTEWCYQQYIKDYLRVCTSMDENIGRVLDYLDEHGLGENTIVVYTSDHGLFLGEHGWFDKRFMYEESLSMPCVVRYPKEIPSGLAPSQSALNLDFASTLLDYAGLEATEQNQGISLRPLLNGETPSDWRKSMYYRYWCHKDFSHNVYAHRGIRTDRYKLIHFYNSGPGVSGAQDEREPEYWEFYDLQHDPNELNNLIADPDSQDRVAAMRVDLEELARYYGDTQPEVMSCE